MTAIIPDEQRTVIQIEFEDGKMFLNSGSFMIVGDPYDATRYAPIDNNFPKRKEGQDKDIAWMKAACDAKVTVVPFLEACKDYKRKNREQYGEI